MWLTSGTFSWSAFRPESWRTKPLRSYSLFSHRRAPYRPENFTLSNTRGCRVNFREDSGERQRRVRKCGVDIVESLAQCVHGYAILTPMVSQLHVGSRYSNYVDPARCGTSYIASNEAVHRINTRLAFDPNFRMPASPILLSGQEWLPFPSKSTSSLCLPNPSSYSRPFLLRLGRSSRARSDEKRQSKRSPNRNPTQYCGSYPAPGHFGCVDQGTRAGLTDDSQRCLYPRKLVTYFSQPLSRREWLVPNSDTAMPEEPAPRTTVGVRQESFEQWSKLLSDFRFVLCS